MRKITPIIAFALLCGCGARATNADRANRSLREFQLAASLREEGSVPGAIQHLRKALELDENNAEAHLLMGFIQMERRAFGTAEEYFQKGIALLKKQDRGGATLAEARNMYGLCLVELGRFEESIAVLEEAASDELNTAPHLAWGNLGLVYLRSGDYQRALEATIEATRLQPRFCVGYFTMGRALVALNRLQEAERALSGAVSADAECEESPALQGAWQLRGEVRAQLGHRRDAVADLERCIELGPHTKEGELCQQILSANHN